MADIQKDSAGKSAPQKHMLSLADRAHAEISGVTEVCSFDEETVVLDTVCGELTLEGTGLRVGALDLVRGVVVVDGSVTAFYYADTRETRKKGRFTGLFR